MEYTTEKKLYNETILEILYKYMEFNLSFDTENSCNYMSIYPTLNDVYHQLKEDLVTLEVEELESLSSLEFVSNLINERFSNIDIISIGDITKGLSKIDIANLSLGLYLKRFRNIINTQLENTISLLSEYHAPNAKFLIELLSMFKTLNLSTSIKSKSVDKNLMPYYASSLGINYDEDQTAKMYSFLMINLLAKIGEILPLVLSEIGLDNLHVQDLLGHIDCFNTHKDENIGSYPIDNLALALGNLKNNLELVIESLKTKEQGLGLQLDIKS